MSLFGFLSKGRRKEKARAEEINSDRAALVSALENGYYTDAARAAERLVANGNYSCMDKMIAGMKDERMASP